ncbi:MAG TPA: hypothetical protein VNT27_06115, partial [Propionibacteriaceae bacterium]|nr:hypothetical protein [Propionibacteriaceae bacterium]
MPLVGTSVALGSSTGRAAVPIGTYSQLVVTPPEGPPPDRVTGAGADSSAAALGEVEPPGGIGADGTFPQPAIRQIVTATTSATRYPPMRITLSRRTRTVADRRTGVRKVIGMVRLTRIYTRT